jgi:chromosomal replication initiator protein
MTQGSQTPGRDVTGTQGAGEPGARALGAGSTGAGASDAGAPDAHVQAVTALWEAAQQRLRERLSEDSFATWIAPVAARALDGDVLALQVPNRFYAEWLAAHYGAPVLDAVRDAAAHLRPALALPPTLRLAWEVSELLQGRVAAQRKSAPPVSAAEVVRSPGYSSPGFVSAPVGPSAALVNAPAGGAAEQARSQAKSQATAHARAQAPWSSDAPVASPAAGAAPTQGLGPPHGLGPLHGLNPKYTFESFVVGPSNQLAHAASVGAASARNKRYNPLFIYGGVGLGKTHLVNAIGHRLLAENPGARVLYLSAERFTNEFIWALQNHRIADFRERYRSQCDLLIVDDIQFLAGREQTQEEFFHTFNALYHADRQIVVTSDVVPQQIPEIEERLVSRFQWGVVADIQAPELDTRIAILRRKAGEEGIPLPDDVALFLAQVVRSNVRELEGTLLRLAVRAEIVRRPIDLDFARETLRAVLPAPEHAVSVEDIQQAVCRYFNIRLADLKSHRRHRSVAYPRMVAMYLCRQRLEISYPQLGEAFGGKDHTTVMSAVRKIGGLLEKDDPKVRGEVEAIERKLGL